MMAYVTDFCLPTSVLWNTCPTSLLLSFGAAQVVELLIKLSGGDLRRSITLLQSASRLHGATDPPTPISISSGNAPPPFALPLSSFLISFGPSSLTSTDDLFYSSSIPSLTLLFTTIVQEIAGVVPDELIAKTLATLGIEPSGFVGSAFKGNFTDVQRAVKKLRREGWSAGTVLSQVRPFALTSWPDILFFIIILFFTPQASLCLCCFFQTDLTHLLILLGHLSLSF
jgi:hypothetical protein